MQLQLEDTICAPATATGGAIGVVRLSGPGCYEVLGKVVTLRSSRPLEAGSVRFGEIPGVDEVLVSCFRAPHSYTGEDCVEIGCHGSSYIIGRIMTLLCEAGARPAEAGEFTRRAFLNGRMDLAEAEAVADLIAAESEYAHRVALGQLRGGYSAELRGLRDRMLEICSLLELELDFSEEDVEFADRSELRRLMEEALGRCTALADSFRAGNAIREGIPVVIAGEPNSGKSTLLNALLGEDRAIVSDIPGTTRDTVEERIVLDGLEFRFIDTAGIRESSDTVERLGIGRTLESIKKAFLVICLEDPTVHGYDTPVTDAVRAMTDPSCQKLITVYGKADLMSGKDSGALSICAPTGAGLDKLRSAIVAASPTASLHGDTVLVTNARHHAALLAAAASLRQALCSLDSGLTADLLAEDVRSAIGSLSSITGEITSQDILSTIFQRFCIGK